MTADGTGFDPIAIGTDIQRRIGVKTSRDEPLGRFTTMRVGGPADLFATAHNAFELRALVRFARSRGLPHLVLGRGSDIVIADAGVRGLVIQNRAEGSRVEGGRYTAESGVAMARAATETQKAGLTGLEFGLAIPGTVGGAVWANAGAHGGEMKDVVVSVDTWDPAGDRVATLDNAACDFAYRESRFKHSGEAVLGAHLRLQPGDPARIAEAVDAHQAQRRATQPLADQNAGSVFRNPPGDHAGRLVDAAGLKGHRIGSAMVSTLHANFIVTDRGGRAADVRALGDFVRERVRELHGIELRYEIEFVGDWGEEVA